MVIWINLDKVEVHIIPIIKEVVIGSRNKNSVKKSYIIKVLRCPIGILKT